MARDETRIIHHGVCECFGQCVWLEERLWLQAHGGMSPSIRCMAGRSHRVASIQAEGAYHVHSQHGSLTFSSLSDSPWVFENVLDSLKRARNQNKIEKALASNTEGIRNPEGR